MHALFQSQNGRTFAISILGAILLCHSAHGQEIRFVPIRSAPLGSPVGTVGDPITPVFNDAWGCWEYAIETGGVEVDIDIQGGGWGNALGNPTLGAIQATVISAGYGNGLGAPLNPKGWPASPGDGWYQAYLACGAGGDGSPCVPPFDGTCDGGANGFCIANPNWIIPGDSGPIIPCDPVCTPTITYVWAYAPQDPSNTFDPEPSGRRTFGGLILDVPPDAAGVYVIAPNPDPNDSFVLAGDGSPIPGVQFTPACITIPPPVGKCCSNVGPQGTTCEDNLTEQECDLRPAPRMWTEGAVCEGECPCPACLSNFDCDDFDACTADVCFGCGLCESTPNYNEATECCNPSNGITVAIADDDVCTTGTCDPSTGQVTQEQIPGCVSYDPDAYTKNRYVSFETGVLTVERAYQVRMTASVHFPQSVGELGWVGAPSADGIAPVVSEPVFLPSWPAMVRVGDCEIGPGATYEIRATEDGVNFGPAIVVDTTPPPTPKLWGDIVGDFNGWAWEPPNGVLNVADVQAAILTFQAGSSAAPLTWADVEPEVPNRIANINDVFALILAFQGAPYPFADPANCP